MDTMTIMNIEEKFKEAQRRGHLVFYPSEPVTKESHGIKFLVRYCEALQHKLKILHSEQPSSSASSKRNPFLPPERELTLANLGESHKLIFNKYCVVPLHMLIVSNEFINQMTPLSAEDFVACQRALDVPSKNDQGWMFFYNSGPESGATQPHRHLQMIEGETPPMCDAFADSITIPLMSSIIHGLLRVSSCDDWYDAYSQLLKLVPADSDGSYSLIFTRHWMLLVPRRREYYEGLSFNAMTFAGYLLACYPKDLDLLIKQHDPLEIISYVGFPSHNK